MVCSTSVTDGLSWNAKIAYYLHVVTYLPVVVVIPGTGSSPQSKGWADTIYRKLPKIRPLQANTLPPL